MEFLDDLQRHVEFGPADARRLARLHDAIADRIPAVAERFHDMLVRGPAAKAAVIDEASPPSSLKDTLVDWLTSGLKGPHDQLYYERCTRIGRRHVVSGLPQQYLFTAMNVLRRELHRALEECLGDDRVATTDSVDKLLDMELAIMLRHYQLEAEERLVRRERGAQIDKLTAMQSLSAGLAHEVRNPLNAAKLQLELLQRRLHRGEYDERLADTAVLIHEEIARLTALLNEFLSFARPAELATCVTDIGALVRHVVELEQAGADTRGIALDIIEPEARIEAEVDAAKTHQIVQNLVRNAIEASPDRGRVTVVVESHAGWIVIRVRDRGSGISPAVLGRIYEPFFSTKEGGTGMGMAIVHSLVALHGGTIEVRSHDGTEFTVRLPHDAA